VSEPLRKKDTKKEKEALDTLVAYRQAFSTDYGKRVIDDLTKRYMMRSSMSQDALTLAFKEGERNVLLTILAVLKIDETQINERISNVR
jgi:predicted type IV restriction endonuclease